MNNEIKIADLKGVWKKWAEAADKYKEGGQDENVNSAFEEYFIMFKAKEANKTEAEVAEIFGAEFAKKYTETTSVTTKNLSKDSTTLMQKDLIKNILPKLSKHYTANPQGGFQNAITSLKEEVLGNNRGLIDANYYEELFNELEKIAEKVDQKPKESREEIIKLYDEITDDLKIKRKDPLKTFKREALQEFILMAEQNQKNKELTDLKDKYKELRANNSREEALKAIKKDAAFASSYYQNYVGPDALQSIKKHVPAKECHNQGVITDLVENTILKEAREEVWAAIENQRGKGLTDGKEIEKAVIDELKANGSYDKYTQKVLAGELSLVEKLNFEKSTVKMYRKEVAADNRVEERKKTEFTQKEFTDNLKDDTIFPALLKAGLVKEFASFDKNKEKTYSLKDLANKIALHLGAEKRANQQKGDLYAYDEVENVAKEIAAEAGIEALSTRDAKALIKMCGFDVDSKNWVKVIYDSTVGTAITGVAALAGAAALDKQVYENTIPIAVDYVNNNEMKLTMTFDGAEVNLWKLMESLVFDTNLDSENIDWNPIDKGLELIIKTSDSGVAYDDPIELFQEFSNRAGETAANALVVGFALNFLKNALQKAPGEVPIAVTQFENKTLDEYIASIKADKNLTPDQKLGFEMLAKSKAKETDGATTWDSEGYKAILDNIAGSQSFLNKHEFAIGAQKELARLAEEAEEKRKKGQPEPVNRPTVTPPPPPAKPQNKYGTEHIPGYQDCPKANYHYGNKHTWQGLAAMYAGSNHSYIEIVHAIKDINGIKYSDNVIPKDLYLPDKLFEDDKITRKDLSESEIKAADVAVIKNTGEIRSNGTKIKCTTVDGRYKGVATKPDGTVIRTPEDYATEEEALDAIKKQLEEK